MINFVLGNYPDYMGVEQSLLATVRRHLSPGACQTTIRAPRAGALNFALFVRLPADIVMSHGVADKNYFTDLRDDRGRLFVNGLKGLCVPGQWMKRKMLADCYISKSSLCEN